MSIPSADDIANALLKKLRSSGKEEQKSAATKIVEMIQSSGVKVVVDQYRQPHLVPPPEWLNSAKNEGPKQLQQIVSVGSVGSAGIPVSLDKGGKVRDIGYGEPTLPTLPGRALSFTGSILEALIAKEFYKINGKVSGPASIRAALVTITGLNISAPSTEFWNRVGVDERGDWWLDLSDGRYVWITQGGWDIIEETPIYFRRHSYQLPLHTPTKEGEGDLFSLLDFITLPDCDSQLLYVICALQSLIPDIPKGILNVTGAYGTVKSSAMGAIVEVFDRTSMRDLPGGLLTMHDNIKELMQNLDHHWICYFDNVSDLNEEQSDALSRASTGASMENRMLYSDDEDVARRFRRCVGFNSIGMVVSKTDLMSRSVVLETKLMLVSQRKTDREVQAHIYAVAGRILGDALTVVARAKKMIDEGFKIADKPRMADFATWGEAMSQAMGFKPGTFLNAYYSNIERAMETVLRTNVVGGLLLDYLENRLATVPDLEFSAHELFTVLREKAETARYNVKQEFPMNPPKLGIILRELAPSLPGSGIRITFKRAGEGVKYHFSRFFPTKIDDVYDAAAGHGVNSWVVDDLRKLRGQLRGIHTEAPKPVEVEPIAKESVGLNFAREALLKHGAFRRGESLKDEDALAFLGKLGLSTSLGVKIIASLMRDGAIFSPRLGYYNLTSTTKGTGVLEGVLVKVPEEEKPPSQVSQNGAPASEGLQPLDLYKLGEKIFELLCRKKRAMTPREINVIVGESLRDVEDALKKLGDRVKPVEGGRYVAFRSIFRKSVKNKNKGNCIEPVPPIENPEVAPIVDESDPPSPPPEDPRVRLRRLAEGFMQRQPNGSSPRGLFFSYMLEAGFSEEQVLSTLAGVEDWSFGLIFVQFHPRGTIS